MVALPRQVPAAKVCRRCEEPRPAGEFQTDPRNRDGLGSYCASCRARIKSIADHRRAAHAMMLRKERTQRREKADIAAGRVLACCHCGPRGVSAFTRHRSHTRGYAYACRDCVRVRARDQRPCECGEPKESGAMCCRACTFLDGTGRGDGATGQLISELRAMGGSGSSDALELETGLTYRQVRRLIVALEQAGRVRVIRDLGDVDSGEHADEWAPAIVVLVDKGVE